MKQVIRQQQLGVVRNMLKHPRQHAIQGVALGNQQVFVKFFCLVGVLELINLIHVQAIQIQMQGFVNNLRFEVIFLVCEHTHTGREVAVDLHEAQSNQAIKPSVGNLLHHFLIAFAIDLRNQCPALILLCISQDCSVDAVSCSINDIVLFNSILHRFLGYTLNQFPACPDSEFFNCIFVHFIVPH